MLSQVQELEQILNQELQPFFSRIERDLQRDPEIRSRIKYHTTEEENTTTFHIEAKPELEFVTFREAFGIKPKHLAD
jgi:hypothetical protein